MVDRFTFFRGFFESINQLPDGSRERVYDAVMRYVFLGIEPQLDYPESLVWPVIKPSVDKNMVSVSNGARGGEASSKKRNEAVHEQNENGFATPLGKPNEKGFGSPLPKPIQKGFGTPFPDGFATPPPKPFEEPFASPLPNQNQKGFGTTKTKTMTETMTKTMTETGTGTETETTTKTKTIDSQEKENREKAGIPQERGGVTVAQVCDLYNDTCVSFPRLVTVSEARKKAIRARLKTYSFDDFRTMFEKAEASAFLKGANDRNWVATFDWMIKDANMAKILEGNYDGRQEPQSRKAEQFNRGLQMMADWADGG